MNWLFVNFVVAAISWILLEIHNAWNAVKMALKEIVWIWLKWRKEIGPVPSKFPIVLIASTDN